MKVLPRLAPRVEVHGLVAATDNMPSGSALKPGDILRAMSGKTIEVNNTDAEGRLTLADAMAYAIKEIAPDEMVDIATLTGACSIALGSLWAGLLLICATPLFGTYLLLQIAMFLRSGANGLAQPLLITLVLRGAGHENQGKAIGLRVTANRVASIFAPLAMGAIAEVFGLEASFYVIGVAGSIAMAAIAVYLWRHPDVARAGED